MVRLLLALSLLISAPLIAGEYSRAMEGSAQVQAARARDKARTEKEQEELNRAIAASIETNKQEAEARKPVVVEKPQSVAPKSTPIVTKSWFSRNWKRIAGFTMVGATAVAYWYFRDTVHTQANRGYNYLTSIYKQ